MTIEAFDGRMDTLELSLISCDFYLQKRIIGKK